MRYALVVVLMLSACATAPRTEVPDQKPEQVESSKPGWFDWRNIDVFSLLAIIHP